MFDFFRKHTRVLQFLLVLLIFPSFVFFGIQGYSGFTGSENDTVAHVAGTAITRNEWEAAQREQIDRVRRQMPNVDAKLFDTPEMKRQSLDAVVRERVMQAAAEKLNLVTSDDRLQRLFATDPQFAGVRNPDGSVNKDALSAQGMSSEMFARRLRQDLSQRQVVLGLTGTGLAPAGVAASALDAMFQQREVQIQHFATKDLIEQVNPSDADLEKYYKDAAHAAEFQAPERESIEYVVLDLSALKSGITVAEKDLLDYYAANVKLYTALEERRASHILVKAEQGAPTADRAKAKVRIEGLLAQLKLDPGGFADLARKNSDDPQSAEKGGDLDFFARGGMAAKALEDAAFGLKPGEVSGVVESEFGFHLVKLTEVRGGQVRSFDAVRAEIESEVKTQLAQKRYAEMAVEFTNMVYEQPDSLKPVADKFKLELRNAKNLQRRPAPGVTGALANAKFLEALFGNDAARNKRNTEAIEIAPNTMVSGRVVEYAAAQQLPFADVKARVRERVMSEQAANLARKLGETRLAALKAAPDTVMTEPLQVVSRAQPGDLPVQLLTAIMKAPAAPLPAVIGVNLGAAGFVVAKINQVLGRDPAVGDPVRAQAQYAQAWGDAESQAYFAALKSRFKVDIKQNALQAAEPAASATSK